MKRCAIQPYMMVALGGTFDELHKGHRALLAKAFEVGHSVKIGLTTDEFAAKLQKNHKLATYEERKAELWDFLRKKRMLCRAEIIPLSDAFGPALTSREFDAIVVSRETELRACELNDLRIKGGLKPLKVFAIEMIPAENHVSISTTRIRHGEIDREGHMLKR